MKIAYGYPYFPSQAYGNVEKLVFDYVKRIQIPGVEISPICISIDPPSHHLKFAELDKLWKRGDLKLLNFYEQFLRQSENADVFINSVGINFHPEFVESLKMLTVFQCNDDPESSDDLSRPVAASYDMCLVGNIAELETYKSWGAKNVFWRPIGLQPDIYSPDLTEEEILSGNRDLDIFMMIDKNYPQRKERLEFLEKSFPNGHFYGGGWPRGFLPPEKQISYLRRAKIGPNVHNSTGPINYRTFYLPANGVLQICDNKSNLGKIFELNKEVVGFDNIKECADLCRYYLEHDQERRIIAANGWKRVLKDYNEVTIFETDVRRFRECIDANKKQSDSKALLIEVYSNRKSWMYCFIQDLPKKLQSIKNFCFRAKNKILKMAGYLK